MMTVEILLKVNECHIINIIYNLMYKYKMHLKIYHLENPFYLCHSSSVRLHNRKVSGQGQGRLEACQLGSSVGNQVYSSQPDRRK